MKKRILAALCLAALCVAALPALAAEDNQVEVYQLVINDHFFEWDGPLTDATMPIGVGNVVYVPYTVFDKDVAGVDFKISYGQKQEAGEHTLTLYSLNGMLVFDLLRGTATDGQGNRLSMRARLHNGKPYIPANAVCNYFNSLAGPSVTLVQYVYNPTDYGVIIRLRNSEAVLSDFAFRQSALGAMKTRYNNYLQSLNTPSNGGDGGGQTPVTPTADPGGQDRPPTPVYLSFQCGVGDGLEQILNTLDSRGACALFLFRPEDLSNHAALVRRIVGTGHSLGLIVPGDSLERAQEALAQGNAQLARIAWTRAHIVLPEGGDTALTDDLEAQGWRCWPPNVSGLSSDRTAAEQARRLLSSIEARPGAARVTMDDAAVSAAALSRLMTQLSGEDYTIRPPLETEF